MDGSDGSEVVATVDLASEAVESLLELLELVSELYVLYEHLNLKVVLVIILEVSHRIGVRKQSSQHLTIHLILTISLLLFILYIDLDW